MMTLCFSPITLDPPRPPLQDRRGIPYREAVAIKTTDRRPTGGRFRPSRTGAVDRAARETRFRSAAVEPHARGRIHALQNRPAARVFRIILEISGDQPLFR